MQNQHLQEGLLLPEREQPAVDSELEQSLSALVGGHGETYAAMTLPSERKAAVTGAWARGEDASLMLDAPDKDRLLMRQAALREWKRELLERTDLDPLIKQLYRWKVNEHIANINMLIASSAGDMRSFTRWNEFVYGKPDEDIYRAALDLVAHDAEDLLADDAQSQPVKAAADTVLSLVDEKRGYRELLSPDETVFEKVREDHMRTTGYYGLLLAGVKIPDEKITTEVADPIIQQVLHNIKSSKGIRDASGASWSVASDAVLRPKTMNMPPLRFMGLAVGHEIGSHEFERVNGARGPIAMAKEGLPRYELGNEGRAVIREQVPYETFSEFTKLVRWRDILRRHIAISYASGVGEDAPMQSSEVYTFMNAIDRMYATKLHPDDEVKATAAAHKKTSDLLTRVLKGTDGKGGAYLKDKVYLEGNVACWLSAALRGPRAIAEGDYGKFNINDPTHLAALRKFGLLPEEV